MLRSWRPAQAPRWLPRSAIAFAEDRNAVTVFRPKAAKALFGSRAARESEGRERPPAARSRPRETTPRTLTQTRSTGWHDRARDKRLLQSSRLEPPKL